MNLCHDVLFWSARDIIAAFYVLNDALVNLRLVCCDGDAGVLCTRGAQPVVHSCLCRSLRAWLGLRFFAGSLAVRISRGGLVRGRDPAVGTSGARKVTWQRSLRGLVRKPVPASALRRFLN